MKRYVASALGVLLALGLLAVQPELFLIALVGAVIGGTGALAVFYESRRSAAPPPESPLTADAPPRPSAAKAPPTKTARRRSSRILLLALILVPVALIAVLSVVLKTTTTPKGAESVELAPLPRLHAPRHHRFLEEGNTEAGPYPNGSGGSQSPPTSHRLERSVAAVPYEGDFEYEGEGGPHWHVEETVRVVRARFAQMSAGKLAATTILSHPLSASEPVAVRAALGPKWTFAGDRAGGRVVAYHRVRDLPIDEPFWPPTRETAVGIGTIASRSLAVILVPSNGSKIDIHAPSNLVRETDPPAERRQFGGKDILTVELDGLEDNADRRVLHLEIAGWIGRTSIYGAVSDLTAWTVVKLLFAGVPGLLVGFLVNRRLKRRFPDTPAPQPA
ncbi:MAG TPA: hypothetical protein VNS60_09845 [Solirubrobacterales bacterium]|nr:hypothetical protein [Solirubrobacterales bacterium]